MVELKPCPVCEGKAAFCELEGRMFVECLSCNMRGPTLSLNARNLPGMDATGAVVAAWNALPRRLRWTRERPTKEGWYWYKHDDGQRIIGRLFHGGLHFPGGNFNSLKDMPGEWAGPIPVPEEGNHV